MTAVMIGIDPHKGSHTAVAISAAEEPLGDLRVRASAAQAGQLVAWAASWPERTWAVEGAGGLGHLLAQQLVAAGEQVLDVAPKLAARARLLQAGDTNKNDPNDALSVAVAALRSRTRRQVAAEDHAAVLKVWAKRHRDLARSRNQVACRLHAVLCELLAGGVTKEITAAHAARILEQITPSGPVAAARRELAGQFLQDLRGLDAQLRETKKKLAAAVRASGTSLTGVFGFGPASTGTVIGDVTDVTRFPSRDHFASYTGTPAGVLGEPRLPAVAAREPAHQPCPAHGRDHPDPPPQATAAPTMTARSPRARPTRKRSGASNGGSATPSSPASRPTPGAPPAHRRLRAREGNRGTTLTPARPADTPQTSSSDKPLPDPPPRYGPPPRQAHRRSRFQGKPRQPLDSNSKEDSIWTSRGFLGLASWRAQMGSLCTATSLDCRCIAHRSRTTV